MGRNKVKFSSKLFSQKIPISTLLLHVLYEDYLVLYEERPDSQISGSGDALLYLFPQRE